MKILLGMSGGIDSTYAAKKLLLDGHDVVGAVLKMHEHTELLAARSAAENVGIPICEIDCTKAFSEEIKKDFVFEYTNGRTPNPCIKCNERVKFKFLYDYAIDNGFDAIATGHYARVVKIESGANSRFALATAADARKDQSYMLYRLPQNILSRLCLPLADLNKENVRAAARGAGILAADRKDSQEICFLPEGNHAEFIESVAGRCPEGDFIDESGNVLGRHSGIIRYTVGQRKGLGISLGERMFVADINPQNNTVTLAPRPEGKLLVRISDMVYSGMEKPLAEASVNMLVKLRYTAPLLPVVAHLYPDGTAYLEFSEAVKAAPGQSAVLYIGGVVMCGGFIL